MQTAEEGRRSRASSSVRRFLVLERTFPWVGSSSSSFGGGPLLRFAISPSASWIQRKAALRRVGSFSLLQALLGLRASRRHFPGVRFARQGSSSVTSTSNATGRHPLKVASSDASLTASKRGPRTSDEALKLAIVTSLKYHDSDRRRSGRRQDLKERLGYVLADTCVAVDYRAVVEEFNKVSAKSSSARRAVSSPQSSSSETTSSPSTSGESDAELATLLSSRFDAASRSCVCPSGWKSCDRQEALAAPYGWRLTLERACKQAEAAEKEEDKNQTTNFAAFTRDMYSFDCKTKVPVFKRGEPAEACAGAAFVLCKEIEPKCGLSDW